MMNLVDLGNLCRKYRNDLKLTQSDVARDTGYSVDNISKFENGKTNNLKIFMWYLRKGFRYESFFNNN